MQHPWPFSIFRYLCFRLSSCSRGRTFLCSFIENFLLNSIISYFCHIELCLDFILNSSKIKSKCFLKLPALPQPSTCMFYRIDNGQLQSIQVKKNFVDLL